MFQSIWGINMNKVNGLLIVSLFTLSACGSGGGSSGSVFDGVFKDSNVSGLAFESGDQKGTTDDLGAFKYEEGENVSFSIGAVNLGTGLGKSIMTPLDLVANGKLTTTEVINKVRFLMMLDEDNTPSNGIEISKGVQEIAEDWEEIDFADEAFPNQTLNSIVVEASVEDETVHAFPEPEAATAHLRSTLLCTSAGGFQGTYTGTENGNIVFIVDPVTGEVNGSSYNPDVEVSVDINNTEAIDYDAGLTFVSAETSTKVFSGKLQSSDDVDGTWVNSSDESSSGAFEVTRLGSDSDSTFRYVASFTGSDKGIFIFNVDSRNNVTGTVFSVSKGDEIDLEGKITDDTELRVTSDAGDEITGFIDTETFAFTSGSWINPAGSGSFSGGGCLLN